MTIFYIPNPTQYLNLTTTLLTINKQQIMSLLREKPVNSEQVFPFLTCYPLHL